MKWWCCSLLWIALLWPGGAGQPVASAREGEKQEARISAELTPGELQWVDLAAMDAGYHFDIRYATKDNFTGEVLYPVARAFLRRAPAEALARVQADLQREGLGLKIFDAYRPLPVQQKMWDLIQDERYVSNPAVNAGRHTRGASVDVTLVDTQGRELPMPTKFDDFSEKAHSEAKDVSPEAIRHRDQLRKAMERHGFSVYPTEWWHFDFAGWKRFPPSSATLETIASKATAAPSP